MKNIIGQEITATQWILMWATRAGLVLTAYGLYVTITAVCHWVQYWGAR